ncbi:MAG: glutathione ABC transporter permease GsiC [Acetobacteraceae bacterium SCN 69-10]|nr:ABC transporter permease [Rhodospirillales bacterium]ODU61112.1 MAG: glutathione ABC transporter permease GsiC [Acetobacteraceae bacterium SCN 69-10]OJY64134.1 MAG: glutathione ABC transporter permease GsiC [Rhodospirillales bacterium 70-18]
MAWLLRRVGISLALIWVVASIVFLAIHLVPGDPAELLLSQGGASPDPAIVADLRDQLGLNRPILVQYADSLWRLLHFDLGHSMQDDSPVGDEIARRLPRTLELIVAAAILAVVVGIPAGTVAATRRGSVFDRIAGWLAGLSLAVPVFVVGTLLVMVFAQWLRWVPAGGYVAFATDPARHLLLLSMPAITIGLGLAAVMFRMTRAAVLDVMLKDYVRTARAKGVAPRRVLVRHVVRTALMPVVTVLALHMGTLLGGTVLVEYVFNWPGLSGLLVSAVNGRDYPEVVGIVLVISILFVALNLAVDILYGLLDPRVRRG